MPECEGSIEVRFQNQWTKLAKQGLFGYLTIFFIEVEEMIGMPIGGSKDYLKLLNFGFKLREQRYQADESGRFSSECEAEAFLKELNEEERLSTAMYMRHIRKTVEKDLDDYMNREEKDLLDVYTEQIQEAEDDDEKTMAEEHLKSYMAPVRESHAAKRAIIAEVQQYFW